MLAVRLTWLVWCLIAHTWFVTPLATYLVATGVSANIGSSGYMVRTHNQAKHVSLPVLALIGARTSLRTCENPPCQHYYLVVNVRLVPVLALVSASIIART